MALSGGARVKGRYAEARIRRTIELDDRQAQAMEEVARRQRLSADDVVGLAISDYLARRHGDWRDWEARFASVVERFRAGVPPGMTPEEIESAVGVVREEHRRERAERPSRNVDAGGH